VSTYRVQLHGGFGFAQAQSIVSYLAQLGVTDCYSSPHFKANPGSRHGYDICDHSALKLTLRGLLRHRLAPGEARVAWEGVAAGAFDRQVIAAAIAEARRRNPVMESSIFDFLHDVLLPVADTEGPTKDPSAADRLEFAMKAQQFNP
jgi:maltooligosyltrehalose synthase